MIMRFNFASFLSITLLLTACGSGNSADSQLVGTWIEKVGIELIEFQDGGTGKVIAVGSATPFTWKADDDGQNIEVEISPPEGAGTQTIHLKGNIDEPHLVLEFVELDQGTSRYIRADEEDVEKAMEKQQHMANLLQMASTAGARSQAGSSDCNRLMNTPKNQLSMKESQQLMGCMQRELMK
jgi:hypothetical protein